MLCGGRPLGTDAGEKQKRRRPWVWGQRVRAGRSHSYGPPRLHATTSGEGRRGVERRAAAPRGR